MLHPDASGMKHGTRETHENHLGFVLYGYRHGTFYGACRRLMVALTKPCFLTMFGVVYPISYDDGCHRRTGR